MRASAALFVLTAVSHGIRFAATRVKGKLRVADIGTLKAGVAVPQTVNANQLERRA